MSGTSDHTDHKAIQAGDHACGITDVGRVRDRNEDALHISADGRLLVVSDGMGGHAGGDVASTLAIKAIVKHVEAAETDQVEDMLVNALVVADETVVAAAEKETHLRGMGAAVIATRIVGDMLHTCHIGDVRAYVRGADGLEQITEDHSLVGALVRAGQLTEEQARVHPRKNELLQAVGTPGGITPGVTSRRLAPGDIVVMCSDGLWEALSSNDLSEGLNRDVPLAERAEALVASANDAGGRDNITVVLYEHRQP